ncbi:MAG: hypothetical protein WC248_07990 [Candidatus Methanomethylophilaceae archaeon]
MKISTNGFVIEETMEGEVEISQAKNYSVGSVTLTKAEVPLLIDLLQKAINEIKEEK